MTKATAKGTTNYLLSADFPPCAAGGRWSDVLVLVVEHLGGY